MLLISFVFLLYAIVLCSIVKSSDLRLYFNYLIEFIFSHSYANHTCVYLALIITSTALVIMCNIRKLSYFLKY